MSAIIMHVDMDAFFVSVEELYDPSLRGQPVIVGGRRDQRGVVAAASYAVRRFGVHSAMPLTQAAKLCPHAIFLPMRHHLYRKASRQIRGIFETFSPQVEMVSVDEAYLNLSGSERLWGTPLRAAELLHQEIARQIGLPCSIGVSTSRLVSKIASDQAKPNGILWIMPGRETSFLAPLPVSKMPGVGKVTASQLRRKGIRTIGEMQKARADSLPDEVRFQSQQLLPADSPSVGAKSPGGWFFGDEEEWVPRGQAKSIGHEETFERDVSEAARLETILADLSQRVAARLREQELYAHTITLKLRYASFHTITRAATLSESTNLDGVILETGRELLRNNWDRRQKVRLLGIHASGLSSGRGQANLLTAATEERWRRALNAADGLRGKYGFTSVQLAGAVKTPKQPVAPAVEEARSERGIPKAASPSSDGKKNR